MIRTIIADDEIEAREGLEFLLQKEAEFEVIRMCKNGNDAVESIDLLKPDLVFLDIQMPEKNGFEVLESLSQNNPLPLIVFITAYDEFALHAFKVHAVDYLQKPFTDERFLDCLNHVKSQIKLRVNKIDHLMEYIREDGLRQDDTQQLIIKSSGKIFFLNYQEIIWIEGFDYYIKIHTSDHFYLVRNSLSRIVNQLPRQFIRIHNSSIINKGHLKMMEPLSRGNYQVKMANGVELVLSKKYKDQHPNLLP